MPIHKVTGGYKWGSSGHVYPTRAGAERQQTAIYASGWREDRKTALALRASPKAETAYVLALSQIMAGVHRAVLHQIDMSDLHQDATLKKPGLGGRFLALIAHWFTPKVEQAYNTMSKDVTVRAVKSLSLIGIDPRHVAGVEAYIAIARKENVQLLTNATSDFLAAVQQVLEETEGLHPKTVAAALENVVSISKARARLIATDQTLKMNAAIAQHRMRAAGVARYRWSTSQDERVREMHAVLNGKEFSFDNPPITNPQREANNPGEDYRCRCVAIPLVDLDD
jgi:SPP1 gp7 family putative phage head morphogenesis protein